MGRLLSAEVSAAPDLYLAGGTTRDKDIPENSPPILQDAEDLFAIADLVIDFTAPDASVRHALIAGRLGKPLVIGTTGLNDAHMASIREAAKTAPILVTPNASLGVNVLIELVKCAAKSLGPEFAIEIFETHHSKKVDAPSGTALALGRAAAEARGTQISTKAVFDRHGHTGERSRDEIGFASLRGGDVVGDHTVFFYGQGERLELTHRATDRALFARGAVQAARWLAAQPPGFYSMKDMLGLG